MRLVWLCTIAISFAAPAQTARWQQLPPTPAPIAGQRTGYAQVNGIRLYYATLPAADGNTTAPPVVLLHGGLANSDYWGLQVRALHPHRAGAEYAHLSPTPKMYDAFVEQITHMWSSQPNWTAAQLATIHTPILVADGDRDEAIVRGHTETIAAMIPHSGLLILPQTSHFALIQAPRLLNTAMLDFLDSK